MDSLENRPVFRVRLKTRIAESFPFFMRIEQGYFFAGLFCVRKAGSLFKYSRQDRLVLRKKAEKRLPEQRGLLYDADKKINTDT